MSFRALSALVVPLALSLSACGGGAETGGGDGAALPAVAAPAGQQWTETVAKTPEGGYRVGNPAAPIKLVEYAAVTCSHCRDFEVEAYDSIFNDFVKSGRVSFEVRNFLLNPYDIPISVLTRCGDASAYFPLTRQFYQNQTAVLEGLQTVDTNALQAQFRQRDMVGAARTMGVIEFFKARGISEDQANSCLADTARADELIKMTDTAAKELEVSGTPTFLINGKVVEFQGWPALRQRLQALGAR